MNAALISNSTAYQPDHGTLDQHSRAVAKRLFAIHPEWEPCAQVVHLPEAETGFLLVSILPSAEACADGPLTLDTAGGWVTVTFDRFHWHFTALEEIDDHDEGALTFIANLMNETIVVWGDESGRNGCRGPGDLPELSARNVRIRSWRGTYNADPM